jgi:hypothetical protein
MQTPQVVFGFLQLRQANITARVHMFHPRHIAIKASFFTRIFTPVYNGLLDWPWVLRKRW